MSSTNARTSYQFLENCLRHKNEMVSRINTAVYVVIAIIVSNNDTNPRCHGMRHILFKPTIYFPLLVQCIGHVCTTDSTYTLHVFCDVGDL